MACEFLLLGFGAGFLNGLLGLPGPLHLAKGKAWRWVEFLIWVMVVIIHHLKFEGGIESDIQVCSWQVVDLSHQPRG